MAVGFGFVVEFVVVLFVDALSRRSLFDTNQHIPHTHRLDGCHVSDEGAQALGEALKVNTTLKTLR